jgi:hypothetical protein
LHMRQRFGEESTSSNEANLRHDESFLLFRFYFCQMSVAKRAWERNDEMVVLNRCMPRRMPKSRCQPEEENRCFSETLTAR